MQKLDIDYSLKKIPIPSNESYLIKLIDEIESVVKQMRWRAHFFLQEKHKSDVRREDFGFKSKITPPQCEHMEAFEKELPYIIPNIKFRSVFHSRCISEVERGHSKNKTVTKRFCLLRQNK